MIRKKLSSSKRKNLIFFTMKRLEQNAFEVSKTKNKSEQTNSNISKFQNEEYQLVK